MWSELMIPDQSLADKNPTAKSPFLLEPLQEKSRTNWAWKMNYLVSSNQGISRLRIKPGGGKGWTSCFLPGIRNSEDNQMTLQEHSIALALVNLLNTGTCEEHSIQYYTQYSRQRVTTEFLRLFRFVLAIWRIVLGLSSLEPNVKIINILDRKAQASCLCWSIVSLPKVWQRLIHQFSFARVSGGAPIHPLPRGGLISGAEDLSNFVMSKDGQFVPPFKYCLTWILHKYA